MSKFSKFVGKITGSTAARDSRNAADQAISRYQGQIGESSTSLRNQLAQMQKQVALANQQAKMQQAQQQAAYDQYLAGQKQQASGETQGVTGTLLQQIQDALSASEAQQRKSFADATNADLGIQAPAIEAFFASRGIPVSSGAFLQSLGSQVAQNKGDQARLESQLATNRFNATSDVYGQQAGLTREDLLQSRQAEMNNFLQKLGFARQDQQAVNGYQNSLNFQTPLDLESQLQNMYMQGQGMTVDAANQGAAAAAQRRDSMQNGLGNLAGMAATAYLPGLGLGGRLASLLGTGAKAAQAFTLPNSTNPWNLGGYNQIHNQPTWNNTGYARQG